MMVRLIFVFLFHSISVIDIHASTITFLHDENIEVKLQDAVHPRILDHAPKFVYPTATIFQLAESTIQFYLVSFNSTEYYLWIEDSSKNIEIDLSKPEANTTNIVFVSKSNWCSVNIVSNNSVLKKLNEIDLYYSNALDSLIDLALADDRFSAERDYNTLVWDSRSAKRLYNLAVEKFSYQFDEKLLHYIPASTQYWQLMYKLYYQYFHTNSFKGQNKNEIYNRD